MWDSFVKNNIKINGKPWTKRKAEEKIAEFIEATRPKQKRTQDVALPSNAQDFIRQYIRGGASEQELAGATDIHVGWSRVWKWFSPCLIFCLPSGRQRISYRSLRDSVGNRIRKKELRIMRALTQSVRDRVRNNPTDHVDDVAPGTFEWRARLFKQNCLIDYGTFDISDKDTQKHWRKFYEIFGLESVPAAENYRRKKESDKRKRLALAVEAAAPPGIKSLEFDRDALVVTWENNGGWDVPEIAYFEKEWLDLHPLERVKVREWLATFV